MLLVLIEVGTSLVFQVLVFGCGTLWFTTPQLRRVNARVGRHHRRLPSGSGDPVPSAAVSRCREATHVDACAGGNPASHDAGTGTAADVADDPAVGLYTGVMVLDAVGTGKTSACMYPYVQQLLRQRRNFELSPLPMLATGRHPSASGRNTSRTATLPGLQPSADHRRNMMIRATVAVCTRNRADLLQRCLASLGMQVVDTDEVEVLVVDNGSTDTTAQLLQKWVRNGVNRRVLRQPRVGLSRARNTALEASDREVVIFLDDDALVPPAWALAHLSVYASGDRVGAAGGPVGLAWPVARPQWVTDELAEWYSALDLGDVPGPYPHPHGPYGTNMSVWRRAALEVGGFDPRFGRRGRSLVSSEERDLTRRLMQAGWAIRYAPSAAVIHQVLPERLTRRWVLRRGWAQGISNARFEVLEKCLSRRGRLAHAVSELRTSVALYARRRADAGDELLVLARALAHARAALELARLTLPLAVRREQ